MLKRRVEPARQPLYTWPERDNRSVMMLQSLEIHFFQYVYLNLSQNNDTVSFLLTSILGHPFR